QLRSGGGERQRRRTHRREANKARIAGDQLDRLGDVGTCEVARIHSFENDDPRILAQFPGELPMTDIDGIDAPGTAGQQYVGEAAGRGADVERDALLGLDRKMIERVGELDAAARYPPMVAPPQCQGRIPPQLPTRVVAALSAPA